MPSSLKVMLCMANPLPPLLLVAVFHTCILTSWWLLSLEGQAGAIGTKVACCGETPVLSCVSETGILLCCPDWPGIPGLKQNFHLSLLGSGTQGAPHHPAEKLHL